MTDIKAMLIKELEEWKLDNLADPIFDGIEADICEAMLAAIKYLHKVDNEIVIRQMVNILQRGTLELLEQLFILTSLQTIDGIAEIATPKEFYLLLAYIRPSYTDGKIEKVSPLTDIISDAYLSRTAQSVRAFARGVLYALRGYGGNNDPSDSNVNE